MEARIASLVRVAILVVVVVGCRAPEADASPQGLPLTFLIASDTHYGVHDSVGAFNREIIRAMNELPGTPYPERIGGAVQVPEGLLLTGVGVGGVRRLSAEVREAGPTWRRPDALRSPGWIRLPSTKP